jgi:hypothetical protein
MKSSGLSLTALVLISALSPVKRADAAGSQSAGNCLQWASLTDYVLPDVKMLVHPASGPDAAAIVSLQVSSRIPVLDSAVVRTGSCVLP